MDWRYSSNPDNIVALGLFDGKVALKNVSYDSGSNNAHLRSSIGKDSSQKHSKSCTSMQWNKDNPNWLATGFEKQERNR